MDTIGSFSGHHCRYDGLVWALFRAQAIGSAFRQGETTSAILECKSAPFWNGCSLLCIRHVKLCATVYGQKLVTRSSTKGTYTEAHVVRVLEKLNCQSAGNMMVSGKKETYYEAASIAIIVDN